jgi:hypothetical protein
MMHEKWLSVFFCVQEVTLEVAKLYPVVFLG